MYYVGQRVYDDMFGFGKITHTSDDDYNMAVEFERPKRMLHDCSGKTAEGRGWWYSELEADILLSKMKPKFPKEYTITVNTEEQAMEFRKWLGKQIHSHETFMKVLHDVNDPLVHD